MPEAEETFRVRFADETKKELRKLGHAASVDILASVKKKLTTRPNDYGEPLARGLAGYRKLPVGQWRVVYHVEEREVLVLAAGKRALGDHENIYDQITREDLDLRRKELRRRVAEEKEEA